MPHLARFAERATTYHKHYSTGNYTTPSTASLLTGSYPWTHRALSHQATPLERYKDQNLFSGFAQAGYTRMGFSHNFLANILLYNFERDLERYILPNEVTLADFNVSDNLFRRDLGLASQAERVYLDKPGKVSNSLFLAPFFASYQARRRLQLFKDLAREYPFGIPGRNDMLYPLEGTVDWFLQQLPSLQQPFLVYMHFMPPHDPYRPSLDFAGIFKDGWEPPTKPEHHFSEGYSLKRMNRERRMYDEFIAYVDAEFGRIQRFLDEQGYLENTWLIFTSDHGEMFERGIWKHTTPVLYEPLLRVPLVIAQPGQTERFDVYEATSSVDLLPTLLHVTGQSPLEGLEGQVLRPFSAESDNTSRTLFALEAKSNPKYQSLHKATLALIKGDHKLIHYIGYERGFTDVTELYNVSRDPEELHNLSDAEPAIKAELLDELLEEKSRADQPYR
jgi:arylsulfatase A-like enzyme